MRDCYGRLECDSAVGLSQTLEQGGSYRLLGLGWNGDSDTSHDTASPELVDAILETDNGEDTDGVALILRRRAG